MSDLTSAFAARPFRPSPWAPGPHAQTLLARTLRPDPDLPYRRERVETPDHDFLDLDWMPEPTPDAPLALVLHGLEGSARRRYVRNVSARLHAHGVRAVALNFRACSGTPNLRPRFYHSGETGDVGWVLELLRRRFPDRPLGAVGFSLGGNILLKLLGERGEAARGLVGVAAAISVPYDLEAGSRLLEAGGMGRVYTWYFLRSLMGKTRAKRTLLEEHLDLPALERVRTLRAFDELATAPLHGFQGAEEYYRLSSSAGFLPGIRVPTLLLHSLDDPFLPPAALPRGAMEENPWIVPAITEEGGHVAFLEGPPWRPRFWADEEAVRFLAAGLGVG
jgi:hypothetical protein